MNEIEETGINCSTVLACVPGEYVTYALFIYKYRYLYVEKFYKY